MQIIQALNNEPEQLKSLYIELDKTTFSHPRSNWFMGIIAGNLGDLHLQQNHFSSYLSSRRIEALYLVQASLPKNVSLAEFSTQLYPDDAKSWFWLGEALRANGQSVEAIQAYQKAVYLDPFDWVSWCWLGYLFRDQDLLISNTYYVKCCVYGNNGSNGCFHAGQTAEKLGNIDQSLFYFNLVDKWSE